MLPEIMLPRKTKDEYDFNAEGDDEFDEPLAGELHTQQSPTTELEVPASNVMHDSMAQLVEIGGHSRIDLEWRNITFRLKDGKTILDDVSGSIVSGSINFLLGPSGSGKTSLMNVLNGCVPDSLWDGEVLVNGHPFNPSNWGDRACFVEQTDCVPSTATVEEVFQFAARLRTNQTEDEIEKLVDGFLKTLRLDDAKKTLCGDQQLIKGCSGGELKRACIGRELLCGASLIFMDEPLSGLDSANARELMEILGFLCKKLGCTVLITVHQPSSMTLQIADDMMFLHKGRVLVNGSEEYCKNFVKKQNETCPPNIMITDHILDKAMTLSDERLDVWKAAAASEERKPLKATEPIASELSTYRSGFWKMFYAVMRREAIAFKRNPISPVTIILPLCLSLMLGFFNWNVARDMPDPSHPDYGIKVEKLMNCIVWAVSFCGFNALFFSMTPLIMERFLFIKEVNSRTYTSNAFYLGKMSVLSCQIAGATIAQIFPLYFMVGFEVNFALFFIACFLTSLCGSSYGCLISCAADSLEIANIMLPIVVHPQFLSTFSGNQDIGNVTKYFTFFAPAANIILQTEEPGTDDGEIWHYFLSLGIQIVILQALAMYFLYRKTHSSKY